MNAPIYTKRTCPHPTTQLHWNYSITWQTTPVEPMWLAELQKHCVVDGILVRDYQLLDPTHGVIMLDSRASVSPHSIVQRLRGRLQALLRQWNPKALAAEDEFRCTGTITRQVIEGFILQQRIQSATGVNDPGDRRFAEYCWDDPTIDLNRPSLSQNKHFWYNLHLVFPFVELECNLDDAELALVWQTLKNVSQRKQHWLRQAEIQSEYVHAWLRGQWTESPEEIALTYLNEIAFSLGKRKAFGCNYLVATESPTI